VLHSFLSWLIDTVSALGYPGLVALMAMESSVIPLPSELVMPPAGYLAAKGLMDPYLAVLAGAVGSIIGALANYAMAVWVGEPFLRRFGRFILISNASLDRAEAFFRQHGEISTFLGRLVPVVRHLISIPAGLSRMRLGRFALFTGLGAGIWCGVLTYIGWLIGQHSAALDAGVQAAFQAQAHDWLLFRVLPAALLVLVAYLVWHRRRKGVRGV
jgi:membrane protein DedA with SNARE-associated domain